MMKNADPSVYTWMLVITYVCYLLNHAASPIKNWRVPFKYITGTTLGIIPLLRFCWYEPVYYNIDDEHSSETREKRGYFIGIAGNVGHSMTYKALIDDTHKIICRSNIRSILDY